MSEQADQGPATKVLHYYQYLGGPRSETVYKTRYFCGECRHELGSPYTHPTTPEDLEAENEAPLLTFELSSRPLRYYAFCPWCGSRFEDEWWKDATIQNERAIDHFRNPGTHRGDTHEFRGSGPDCMAGHYLSGTDSERVCWCDPEIEPGILGCVIRHRDVKRPPQ